MIQQLDLSRVFINGEGVNPEISRSMTDYEELANTMRCLQRWGKSEIGI